MINFGHLTYFTGSVAWRGTLVSLENFERLYSLLWGIHTKGSLKCLNFSYGGSPITAQFNSLYSYGGSKKRNPQRAKLRALVLYRTNSGLWCCIGQTQGSGVVSDKLRALVLYRTNSGLWCCIGQTQGSGVVSITSGLWCCIGHLRALVF